MPSKEESCLQRPFDQFWRLSQTEIRRLSNDLPVSNISKFNFEVRKNVLEKRSKEELCRSDPLDQLWRLSQSEIEQHLNVHTENNICYQNIVA